MNAKNILWIDSLGGLFAGTLVLLLRELVADWHHLPVMTVTFLAAANLVYGSYALTIALRKTRTAHAVAALAIANMCWPLVCTTLLCLNWSIVSWTAIAHLVGEGLYVGALGWIEWKMRNQIARG